MLGIFYIFRSSTGPTICSRARRPASSSRSSCGTRRRSTSTTCCRSRRSSPRSSPSACSRARASSSSCAPAASASIGPRCRSLLFSLVWSGALFGIEESVLATSNRHAAELKHVMRGGQPRTFNVLNRQWVTGRDERLYHYTYFDPRQRILSELEVYRFDRTLAGRRARCRPGRSIGRTATGWPATGWVRRFSERGRQPLRALCRARAEHRITGVLRHGAAGRRAHELHRAAAATSRR